MTQIDLAICKRVEGDQLMTYNHPVAEVFGFAPDDFSEKANHYRKNRLCPFNNKIPNCTKDKANDPLGVCTINDHGVYVITCPVRFRQDWLITRDAASFLFPPNSKWTTLTEVRLSDKNGQTAGNIDFVLVSYDDTGKVIDFGALEVQAVYVSGNIRRPFEYYMENPETRYNMDWRSKPNYPRADYLSSSRKRLIPQLMYKGTIFAAWHKKMAVAIHKGFFETLPPMTYVDPKDAELAWLVYDLSYDSTARRLNLTRVQTAFCRLEDSIQEIISPEVGPVEEFIEVLQDKLHELLEEKNAPDLKSPHEILGRDDG